MKPWVITAAAALVATASVAVVVTTVVPQEADVRVLILFWVALGVGTWAALTTVLLWCRMNLTQAVWVGCICAVGLLGVLLAVRAGYSDRRLLGGLIFATLLLSFFIWLGSRHGRTRTH